MIVVIHFYILLRNKKFKQISIFQQTFSSSQTVDYQTQNLNGDTIIHEMVKQNDYNELKNYLNL